MEKLQLEVLPYRLILATLKKKDIPRCAYGLLRASLLFAESASSADASKSFFSFSDTPHEISLILMADAVRYFPHDTLNCCSTVWRCIQLFEGAYSSQLAENLAKTIRAVSEPLANRGISIFQVSTYSGDFTLVPEAKLTVALDSLRDTFVISMPYDDGAPAIAPCLPCTSDDDESLYAASYKTAYSMALSDSASLLAATLPVSLSRSDPVCIASLCDDSQMESVLKPLLQRMIFTKAASLFSLTIVDGHPSFILDKQTLQLFPANTFNLLEHETSTGHQWRIIEIGDSGSSGLGFDQPGIVAKYSAALELAKINCFYLSTFLYDFVLVPSENHKQALDVMQAT